MEPMNHPVLHTGRLVLRPLHVDDAGDLFEMYADPETMRFDPEPPHPSVQHTRDYLTREMSYPGSYFWTIILQGTQKPVGLIGFLGGAAIPGIGYILRRDLWGQGLTAEACQPVLEYGFTGLRYDRVELWIEPQNLRSQRVAGKAGATLRSSLKVKYRHRPDHHLMLVYGITADEWRGTQPPAPPAAFSRSQPVFYVNDVLDSVNYYHDLLGFTVDFLYRETPDARPVHAGVARGEWSGSRVVIQLSEAQRAGVFEPASYLYIFVDSHLDHLFAQYQEHGVDIVSPPQNYPWGLREFAIRDPDGHVLRFGSQT